MPVETAARAEAVLKEAGLWTDPAQKDVREERKLKLY